MTHATDNRRSKIRAYVISPLPLAVGLLTGAGHASAAGVNPAADITNGRAPINLRDNIRATSAPAGGRGYSAKLRPKALANVVTCTVVNDVFSTQAQQQLTGNVRDNDGPAGHSGLVASFTQGAHGIVSMDVLNDATNGAFVYTPDTGFSGTDNFTYSAQTNSGNCYLASNAVASVSITIIPVATADTFTAFVGTSLSGNVLSNDIGSGLRVIGNTTPAHGSANVAPDGSFIYLPQAGYNGPDSFQYTITDTLGASQTTAVVSLQIAAAAAVSPTPATSTGALGLLASLLVWLGLRRRRES